jgi:alkylation response protein AidB-like acyl-CoA dehydrogenase
VSLSRTELQDAARQAFGAGGLVPDPATSWSLLTDMGFFGLTVPQASGGLGLGAGALSALHYELGRALVPGPAIPHMLVIEALAACGLESLLERALAGDKMTIGHFACDADQASHVLVGGEAGIYLVPTNSITLSPHRTWDETRRLFAPIDSRDGQLIADGPAGAGLAESLKKRLCAMLAADSLGGADALLALTIDYLKTRTQFDRPIAMFQALKHRVADLKAAVVGAEALLWSCAGSGETTLVQFGALKAHATRVYRKVAEEAIQLHGGIGLTQEHHCHLFLKRAMLNSALGGDADYWDEITGREALTRLRPPQ